MSKILYEVYKNDIKDSESVMYGKYYARLKSIETMSMARMAGHVLPDRRVPEGRCRQGGGLQRQGAPEGAAHPLSARPGCRGQHLEPRVHQEG